MDVERNELVKSLMRIWSFLYGHVSSKRIEKIVKDLGIEYPQAQKWLDEAIVEIQRKKIKKGIANFLETFLKEKMEKEKIKN